MKQFIFLTLLINITFAHADTQTSIQGNFSQIKPEEINQIKAKSNALEKQLKNLDQRTMQLVQQQQQNEKILNDQYHKDIETLTTKLVDIIKEIKNLKEKSNYFKDYIFPITSALFSSLLGGAIAYFTLRNNENIQIEKEKINAANKWLIRADEFRESLIAIKSNYHNKLTEHPLQRAIATPYILMDVVPQNLSYEDLVFIVPKSDKKDLIKWSQIGMIRGIFSNYYVVIGALRERNAIDIAIRRAILQKYGGAFATVTVQDVLNVIPPEKFVHWIDLTERVIKLTDQLIIEFVDFLKDFPDYSKSIIDAKKLKKYGPIIKFMFHENLYLLEILKESPEVDFTSVEFIFGQTSDLIKQRHRTGYEKS